MLTDRNIAKINDQIERELRTVDSWCSNAEDKANALDRITKLKALLYPQPSTEEILTKFVEAVNDVSSPATREPTPAERLIDVLFSSR